jgi:hypothetical protein
MRAFEGQHSDNQPIRRSVDQKKRLLAELRQTLAAMKPHVSPSLRASVQGRIAELEQELAASRKP